MTVTSGRKWFAVLRLSGPLGSLARMCLGSPRWRSSLTNLQWMPKGLLLERSEMFTIEWDEESQMKRWRRLKVSDTKSSRLLFRLVPSMPRTNGNGSGLWPTPNARDHKDTGANVDYEKIKKKCRLAGAVGGPVNPVFSEWLMGYPVGWTDLGDSATPSSRKSSKRSAE